MKARACLRSGWCCKKAPCAFGAWDEGHSRCVFLGGERPGEHYCRKHDEIISDPSSVFSPAFGSGCCAALNSDRQGLVRRDGESYIEVEERV
jgi:hypothetical protein